MITKTGVTAVIAILCLGILGCGGLRFFRDFAGRPGFSSPADRRPACRHDGFCGGEGRRRSSFCRSPDRAAVVLRRGWGEAVGRRLESDEAFRKVVAGYLAKRANVSFSDPELSGRIGELTGTDAFLLVRVDYWNYTTENDKEVGQGEPQHHHGRGEDGEGPLDGGPSQDQRIPDHQTGPSRCGEDLIREMIGYMPH